MMGHHGMRPQDIVILLKIISTGHRPWQQRHLATELGISVSEISVSLNRSQIAGLVDGTKKRVHRQALLEFLQHGVRYVFPEMPGSVVIGMPTAHSHPYFQEKFISVDKYVWPDSNGQVRGQAIDPLHPGVPGAAVKDPVLYQLLASVDILRVGKKREIEMASALLKKMILQDPDDIIPLIL